MRTIVLSIALLISSTLSAGDPWTKTEIGLEAIYQILLVADWRQTSNFHKTLIIRPDGGEQRVVERNILLGPYPSQASINLACILSSIGHFLVSNALPHNGRIAWQGLTVTIEAVMVRRNYQLGVKLAW